jgi:hypothetical protein
MVAGLRHDLLAEIVAKPSGVIDGGFAKAAQRANLRAHAFERSTLERMQSRDGDIQLRSNVLDDGGLDLRRRRRKAADALKELERQRDVESVSSALTHDHLALGDSEGPPIDIDD